MAESKCWRFLLFIPNFLVFAVSIVVTVIAAFIYLRNDDELISQLGDKNFHPIAVSFLAVGAAVILVSLLGCLGAYIAKEKLLVLFCILMSLVIVAEIGGCFAAVYYYNDVEGILADYWKKSMESYDSDGSTRKAWDRFQTDFKCCGLDAPSDWVNHVSSIPSSCCAGDLDTGGNCVNANFYTEGCRDEIKKELEDNLQVLMYVGFGVAGFQLLNVLFACCAICGIHKLTTEFV